jgi:NAD(P)-dependent dehydrogenase (short-subunit alcohol dehydrogenase family)
VTAFVTGAAGGIGGAGYLALRDTGLDVVGQDKDPFDGARPELQGDLRDPAVFERVADALARTEHLDALVAAHGIEGAGTLREVGEEYIRDIMTVNFELVVRLWEAARPALERSGGAFVVIASQAGLVSEEGDSIYCASKSSLRGWLRGLEPSTSARLRLLHPGGVRTALLMRALGGMAVARGTTYEEFLVDRYKVTPSGRIAEPVEAGAAIAWAAGLRTDRLVELAITGGEVLW